MPLPNPPNFGVAIAQLTASDANHYAIWILQAPHAAGHVHRDCTWTDELTQAWEAWKSVFSLRSLPAVPAMSENGTRNDHLNQAFDGGEVIGGGGSYTSRVMQNLGIALWQWLFDDTIESAFAHSQGIAMGQQRPLRVRLDVRDPNLIALPWEIMQSQPGRQAISLSQQILFSRSSSHVDPLPPLEADAALTILLVLGHNDGAIGRMSGPQPGQLNLQQEATMLRQLLEHHTAAGGSFGSNRTVPCRVQTLIEPTPAELIAELEQGSYNIFFYAGHGEPAPDGGMLFLRTDARMNGTELAQVLTRCRVKLAVFNACWGALPDHNDRGALPRSSLAETLLHHGVPAVLGMRDPIADHEALSFIQVFAQSLSDRLPVDQAVAIARQHLLTLYKFNQPAWTLPVLYMHPEFDGQIVLPAPEDRTELPTGSPTSMGHQNVRAMLRSVQDHSLVWLIRDGIMRVGRRPENDLVIAEQWVSQRHAEIFCRSGEPGDTQPLTYFIRDYSRFGTHLRGPDGWQRIHRQEVVLAPGAQLRFGSSQGQLMEFVLDPPDGESTVG